MPELIEPFPSPIGVAVQTQPSYVPSGNMYDFAIAGIPFFTAASQQYPYKRETAPYRRTQIDQTREPGEQTLLGWWLRSQSSFHFGAGVKYQEPVQGDTVGFRFWKSAGINPWTIGKVTLLNDVSKVAGITITGSPKVVGGVDANGVNVAIVSDGSTLYRVLADGTKTTLTWGGSGNILALATDGTNYYVANATNVYGGPLTGGSSGSSVFAFPASVSTVSMGWAKQRLIVGAGAKIWEIVPGAAAPTTPIYAHPLAGWRWSSIADGPNCIYVAGYNGTSSSIYRLSLDTSGALPTLSNAVTAADLPGGEYITSIATYVGKFIAIGTNYGIRIGSIDTTGYSTSGQITYGPITVYTNGFDPVYNRTISGTPVYQFAFDDRFVYATATNVIDDGNGGVASGLIRIDLSRDNGGGMMAWATDLNIGGSTATGVATVGYSGKKIVVGTAGVYIESSTTVSTGYMDTGQIRYLTLEDKHFKLIKPRITRPIDGSVTLSTITIDGAESTIMTIDNSIDPTEDIGTGLRNPSESIGFRFLLNHGTGTGPEFNGYQLKALPAVRRQRQLTIPVMNYDFEEDRYNVIDGYEGRAGERLLTLETIESLGDVVTVQDFTLGESVQAVIESLEFVRITPPERRYKGFGGILYITARTV